MIRLASRYFVPVALNLYQIRAAKTPAGEFFRKVQAQRPAQYQGIYLVSPEGKVLASQGKQPEGKSWTRDLEDTLRAGLTAFGAVSRRDALPADPHPHRGYGLRSDDSIIFAVSLRPMRQGLDRRGMGSVTLDRVELTAAQVERLTVGNLRPGDTWNVPASVMRQFYPLLAPSSDKAGLPRLKEVTEATLTVRVERVERGIATLHCVGKLAGSHVGEFDNNVGKRSRGEVTLAGVGECDARSGRLLSLTLVSDGTYRHFPPYDQPERFGGSATWRRRR